VDPADFFAMFRVPFVAGRVDREDDAPATDRR
jgi:hypothetical protein